MSKRSIAPQRGFFPQPVYLIGAFKQDGAPTFTLITWLTFCSVNPPVLMFSSSLAKATPALVEKGRVFSANLVTTEMLGPADYFGATSGHKTDKVGDTGVAWKPGEVLEVPVLGDSPWVFECTLLETHRVFSNTVFFGEVKNIMVDDRIQDVSYGKVDMADLDPAIYAPTRYYSVGTRLAEVGFSRDLFPGRGR